MTIVCVPGVSGCRSVTQPCATDRPVVPARQPENVVRGQDDVQQGCLHLGHRHGLAVDGDGGRYLHVALSRAHVRNSSSVVPFPSNVLHSTEAAATNILVPGFTVHDSTPSGPNGATVPPRSSTQMRDRRCRRGSGRSVSEGSSSTAPRDCYPASSPGRRRRWVRPGRAPPQRVTGSG